MMEADNKFKIELLDHSKNPPGNDPVLGAFYKALFNLFESSGDFRSLIEEVKKHRSKLTGKHLINLLFRAYQYIKFLEDDLTYVNFTHEDDWLREFRSLSEKPEVISLYKKLLMEKSTNTTIYQRYAGPYVVLSRFFRGKEISVMDVGCGGNYGLTGIHLKEPFREIADNTKNKMIGSLLSVPIHFNHAMAIDIDHPEDPEVRRWRLSCSFYPKELHELENVLAFEKRIGQKNSVKFLQTDFLKLNGKLEKKFDVIIFCVMLYQHDSQKQTELLENAKRYLNPGGIIIVQDFASKHKQKPDSLDFETSWFGGQNSYRTFICSEKTNWHFKEVLRWSNGRCIEVFEGEDFELLINPT